MTITETVIGNCNFCNCLEIFQNRATVLTVACTDGKCNVTIAHTAGKCPLDASNNTRSSVIIYYTHDNVIQTFTSHRCKKNCTHLFIENTHGIIYDEMLDALSNAFANKYKFFAHNAGNCPMWLNEMKNFP